MGGEHTLQYTDDVLSNCTLVTHIILLTNVTPISSIKIKKKKRNLGHRQGQEGVRGPALCLASAHWKSKFFLLVWQQGRGVFQVCSHLWRLEGFAGENHEG